MLNMQQQQQPLFRIMSWLTKMFIIVVLISSLLLCDVVLAQQQQGEEDDSMYRARELAKPWLMRRIEIGDTKLPFSPASVITLVIVLLNVILRLCNGGNSNWAEASHILIKDPSEKTQKAMTSMKTDIGTSLKKFEEYASKYSQCPSRNQKGDLGRFKPGAMTPPFNDAVFNPTNATKTTIGPIKTQFGYHLIYIHDRTE